MRDSGTESTAGAPLLSRAWWAAVLVVVPTVLGLLTFAYRYLDDVARGNARPYLEPLVEELSGHFGGVLLLAPLLLIAWRLGLSARPWAAWIGFHIAGVALYSVLHTTFNWLSREALFPVFGLGDYDYGDLPVRYAMELPKDISSYVLVLPLVENAIHHGAPPVPGPARIEMTIRKQGDALRCEVADNGPGPRGSAPAPAHAQGGSREAGGDASASPSAGTGLANTAARLRGLYGGEAALTLDRGRLGGMSVVIRIPLRREPRPADEPEEAWTGSAS